MKFPLVTISVALCTTALYLIFGAIPEDMIWHQSKQTQVWRWFSAHFVHISAEHLIWNVVALMILGAIIEQTSRAVLGFALMAGAMGVNIYLAAFYSLDAYAGLSGILNTLLVVALYFLFQQPGYKLASVTTLLLSLSKIFVEYCFDFSVFSKLLWPSVPEAHLAGLLAGSLLVIGLEFRKRRLFRAVESLCISS